MRPERAASISVSASSNSRRMRRARSATVAPGGVRRTPVDRRSKRHLGEQEQPGGACAHEVLGSLSPVESELPAEPDRERPDNGYRSDYKEDSGVPISISSTSASDARRLRFD